MSDIDTVRFRIQDDLVAAQQDVLDKADRYRSRYNLQDSEMTDIFKMIGDYELADAWEDYINE